MYLEVDIPVDTINIVCACANTFYEYNFVVVVIYRVKEPVKR